MIAASFPQRLACAAALLLSLFVPATAPAQDVPRFDIRAIRVEGNTLLPQEKVDALVKPFIGKQKDFGDVQGAVEALEQAYQERGYTTVSVLLPEQALEQGEIRLRVVEGRIRSIALEGEKYFGLLNIRDSVPSLRVGEVPQMDDLSASLRVANEHPMKKLSLRLVPGEKEDELDAAIRVTDEKPWRVGATLDNTGTEQTGRRRLGFTWQYGNLFDRDHQLALQYQTSPDKLNDVAIYAASYRIPLYAQGDSIDFVATYSDVNAGTISAGALQLSVTGRGSSFGARYNWNLKRHGDYEHQMVFGFDDKALKNGILASGQQLGNDVTVHPVSVSYNGRWMLPGNETGFFASFARNVPWGSDGGQDAISRARVNAPADFQVLRGGLNLSREFARDWQWRVGVNAQWTNSPLVPSEQFGVGGMASVRGFEERERANDTGVQGNLEVYTPDLLCQPVGASCRVLAFYDFGNLRRNSPLPGETASEHVASAGFGGRYVFGKRYTVQADYARVVDPGTNIDRGAWKLHARVGIAF